MGRSTTKTHIVTRRIYTEPWQAYTLSGKLDLLNRIYNNGVRHYRNVVDHLKEDVWYQKNLALWKDLKDKDEELSDVYFKEICACMDAYGLTEFGIHSYLGAGKVRSCTRGIGINIVQKAGSALYASIKKAVFSGTSIHFRKHGQTDSMEDKRANSGVIYKPESDTVHFQGMVLRLKPVRKSDAYMMQALNARVKYCRIKREPFRGGYRWFLQIVLEGPAPEKIVMGKERCGIDPGISTAAATGKCGLEFIELAKGVKKYQKAIRAAGVEYERRRRMANPQNYNSDGTIKRDTKTFHKQWVHTKGMERSLMRLKAAYRDKRVFIQNSHGYQTNRLVEKYRFVVIEPMDYRALAKRAKKLARQDKESVIKKKDGTEKKVRKYKRRKRFGGSIGLHSPGAFFKTLKDKLIRYGGSYMEVDIRKFRASQYDHEDDTYKKPALSERSKKIGGHRVQRDLYSSFLLYHAIDTVAVDREGCRRDFKWFLKEQGGVVTKMIHEGDTTGNFGLRDFVNDKV